MNLENRYMRQLRRLKWTIIGLSILFLATVEAYYYLFRGVPLIDNLNDWIMGMVGAVALIQIAFHYVGKQQHRLHQTLNECKQAEEDAQESEERTKAIYDGLPIPTVTWQGVDEDFVLIGSNQANNRMTQGKVVDFIGKRASEIYSETSEVIEDLSTCFETRQSIQHEMKYHSISTGETKYLSFTYGFIPPDLVIHHAIDITERIQAERVLEKEKDYYRSFMDSLDDWVWEMDAEGNHTYSNAAVEAMLGYSPEQVVGHPTTDLWLEDGRTPEKLEWLKQSLDSGRGWKNYQAKFKHKNGSTVLVESTAIPLFDSEGNLLGYRGMDRDITARKQVEEALQRQLEELGVLHAVALAGAEVTSEEELIERVNRIIGERLYPENFGVLRLDESRGMLRDHHSYRGGDIMDPIDTRVGEGITGLVALDGRLRNVPDTRREPAYMEVDSKTRSELCVPLTVGDKVIGVINAESTRLGAFNGSDERLLTTIAGQLATALEKKRLFDQIRENEERYRWLVELSPEAIAVHCEGKFVFVNPAGAKLIGAESPEDLIGKPVIEIVHPDQRAEVTERIRKIIEEGKDSPLVEEQLIRLDGRVIDVEVAATPIIYENQPAVQAVARDITERRAAERALQESEARYRAIFDQAADSIVLVDVETGVLVEFNTGAYENLGYTRSEFKKLKIPDFEVFESAEQVTQHIQKILEEGADFFETKHRTKSGKIRDIQVSSRAITLGEKNYIQSIWHDITERKALQRQLIQAERLAAIGQVAAGVAHEVNTPLASISVLCDNLRETSGEQETLASAEQIMNQVKFTAHIVKDLLNFASLPTLDMEKVELESVLEAALTQLALPDWVHVQWELDPDLPTLEADPIKLQEIITNLIANSVDAMEGLASATLTLGLHRAEGGLELRVADTGCGIPEADLPRLYQPFFTTKPTGKGTGLGLAITQRLVEVHGWKLDIASQGVGRGTVATLTLPLEGVKA